MIALHLLASVLVSYAVISLVEYVVHRTFMHHMRLASRFGSNFLKQLCRNHMSLHHKKGYKHSSAHDEQDDVRWQVSLAGFVPNVLICMALTYIDPITGVIMFCVGTIYGIVWWAVHNEMHRQEDRAFAGNALFRYIERRHQLHHQFPKTNYNLLLPLWDWIFATEAPSQKKRKQALG
jgi:hypothetical protein